MPDSARAAGKDLIKGATGDWETVIGLEVHAQVASKAKLFSGASTAFGGEPNSHVSLVDAAMPGMLPVINEECIAQAVRTGLGLKAKINLVSVFDRKNYFYPDLPQGYQISQYKQPIVGAGEVEVGADGESVTVGIERLHLEQDAGKLIHDQHAEYSLVDLNRAGVALMEIVSRPDMRSAKQAQAYVTKLRSILRYLGTSDADMEKGNLRADLNVSVRRAGDTEYGTRCEIKNVNSIRSIGQAIDYEARRQIDILEDGGTIRQETRLFDSAKGVTRSMRTKEEAHDYRYFPDPDLLPLELTQDYVDGLRQGLPELPDEKRARFIKQYGLSAYDAGVLTAERESADFFEAVAEGRDGKAAANWVINELFGRLNKDGLEIGASPVSARQLGGIIDLIASNAISGKIAKDVFEIVWSEGGDPADIVEKRGLKQVTDTGAIEAAIDAVIAANPDKVEQAKAKPQAVGWFVGQVMKATGGKANPQAVNELLQRKLGSALTEQVKRPTRQDFSTLDRHRRQGKVFTPPLMTVTDNLQLHSWSNERLPEALWTALLASELPRPEYMRLLSAVAKAAMNFRDQPEVFPAHSALASISKKQFPRLFDEVLKNKIAGRALAPLLLLDSLPDRAHWSAHLSKPRPDEGWNALARAIAASFHPRSPAAMDSRWLRVMFLGLQHRLLFRKEHEDVVEMLCAYPEGRDVPDWADAMISAMEPAVDIGPNGKRLANWSEKFWNDCLKNTPCIRPRYTPPVQEPEFDYDGAKKRWGDIYAGLAKHFFKTNRTTGIDARHDAVFGLALYAMSLVTGLMRPHSTRPSGRHLLRSLAEVHITLAYLALKDDPATWQMYRVYGIGQAKLTFLKLVESEWDDLPRHVDLGVLERLANEDMWQEFVPVDVGHWAGLTVRKMAEDAGVKEIYDNYYVWPSGHVHGHWGAVRDSVFDLCANPLHRFHRIPRPMRVDMPDLCFDAIRVMNRTLALVEKTFPPFDLRFDEKA